MWNSVKDFMLKFVVKLVVGFVCEVCGETCCVNCGVNYTHVRACGVRCGLKPRPMRCEAFH